MNQVRKRILLLCICCMFVMPIRTFSQQANRAIEPPVRGQGVIDLLAGGTLDAWQVPSDHWYLQNGSIVGDTGEEELESPEWFYTKQRFADFEFTCELKLTGGNHRNTGIYYRVNTFLFEGLWDEQDDAEERAAWQPFKAPSGYEMDAAFYDSTEENYWGSLGDWYARPLLRIFADQALINQVYKPSKWNRMTIRAFGNRLEYWINGTKVMDFTDPDPKASREGIIGFQIHDGAVMKVEYRNIRVKPLEK